MAHAEPMWEFPKIMDSNIDLKIVGLLLQGRPQQGPTIFEGSHLSRSSRHGSEATATTTRTATSSSTSSTTSSSLQCKQSGLDPRMEPMES